MKNVILSGAVTLTLASFGCAGAAAAQTDPADGTAEAPEADEPSYSGVQDIVVTAQRRSQLLSEVPAAVSALGSDSLEQNRIMGVQDLDNRIPSFKFTRFNLSDSHLYIRGIGSNLDSPMLDRSVATFIDDVYVGRAASAASDIFDLERVEVLRGPQGTLYGKNVVGGAINFVTPTPSDVSTGKITFGLGNYDQREVGAVISGGIAQDLAGSLSASYRRRDGYSTNLATGNDLDDEKIFSVRAIGAYEGEGIRLKLSADYSEGDGAGRAYYSLYDGTIASGVKESYRTGTTPRRVNMGPDGFQKVKAYGVTGRAEIEALGGTVTSITAYRGSESDIQVGYIGTGIPRQPNGLPTAPQNFDFINSIDETAKQFSQELRYLRETDAVTILAGLYYLDERVDRFERTDQNNPTVAAFREDALDGYTRSYAGYLDLAWRPFDGFEIDAGVRYTYDKRRFDYFHTGTPGPVYGSFPTNPFSAINTGNWDAITPKLSIRYEVTPRINAYAVVSRGFKSGGFDGQPASSLGLAPIQPEYVWNYEAGLKGVAFDGLLRFELVGFHMDYTDLQTQYTGVVPGTTVTATVITNAASARVNGIETSFDAEFGGGFSIGGTMAVLDTKITESLTPIIPIGARLPNAPKFSFSANATYVAELSSNLDLTARVDYSHTGNSFQTITNIPQSFKPSYDLLDASLTLATADGLALKLWGRNLTDKLYVSYVNGSAVGGSASYGAPRTYGASITYSW